MKKPKLVVNNKRSRSGRLSYREFKPIAEQLLDVHRRYPEITALKLHARANGDTAMLYASSLLFLNYCDGRDFMADHERQKLKVVKKKRTKKVESTKPLE